MIIKDFAAGLVYKLHDGDDPLGMMGLTVLDADPSINRGRMSAKVQISRQSPDRSRDIMLADGAILEDHRKNPTVQIQHSRTVPCGRAEDGLRNYTVKKSKDGQGWEGETYFSQSTKIGEQTFRLVEERVLCGASVGFLPVYGQVEKSHAGGVLYKQWRLVEYSHVAIPDHPDCLVEVVYKGLGGKPLCDPLLEILRPLCPERRESVVGGWEPITKGKRGCVVASLTGRAAKQVIDAGRSIADEDLAEDGRETDPHVTVRYGFMPSAEVSEIERIASIYGPLSFALGKVGVFENEEHDVLYYEIVPSEGPVTNGQSDVTSAYGDNKSLWDLNESLAELPHEDTHPDYKSHACIAYVKPGMGEKYRKMLTSNRSPESCFVSELVYSDAKKERVVIPLVGTKSLRYSLPKSLRYTHKPKRFLPGLRTKAMPATYDDPNAVATVDDTGGDFIDPLDDPEEQGSGMKSGAEFMHLVNDWMQEGLQLIEDRMSSVDNATAKKTGERITVGISKMMKILHGGYGKYREEHPDQPELPGAEAIGPSDGDEDEDGTDDFEDDDDGLDSDDDGEDGDADGKKKPKKKKKKTFGPKEEKAAAEWRVKANHSYWEDLKRIGIAAGYAPVITKAIADLKGDVAFEKRTAVKEVVKSLGSLLVTKAKAAPAASPLESLSIEDFFATGVAAN